MKKSSPQSSQFSKYSAIAESTAKVIGDEITELETYQDFSQKGTSVSGGSAAKRSWPDKSFIPITLETQCIDCLHCVVNCPHQSIGYEVTEKEAPAALKGLKILANKIPGVKLSTETLHREVSKGNTDYDHCKGCFICASACPTGAIHFIPKEQVDEQNFSGEKIEPEKVESLFKAPSLDHWASSHEVLKKASLKCENFRPETEPEHFFKIYNGSAMLADFVVQADFSYVTMFPITPNTSLLKILESKVKQNCMAPDFRLRTPLSEESGYAYLTGAAAVGKRALIAQGSQSLAQIYEFLNINPGLHLPVFLLELTRAISPGTTIKPDHTTTIRTLETGEIVFFGRDLQDNYDKALLLLKLMESEGVWIPGRLVIKGFVETHALNTSRQVNFKALTDRAVKEFLGSPKNPFVLDSVESRSVGILDFDARYAEQRRAIDEVLIHAGDKFDGVAEELSKVNGRKALRKVYHYPEEVSAEITILGLNDPDMSMIEYVCDLLRAQGISCSSLSINLFRPFPNREIADALKECKALAIVELDNWGGRSRGGTLAQEVRSALYDLDNPPEVIAVQMGLGGRAITTSYIVTLYRMLNDLAKGSPESKTKQWLEMYAPDYAFTMGVRGEKYPNSDSDFDVPIHEEGVTHLAVVGKGGQGLLSLNSLLTGVSSLLEEHAISMPGYGALQRGGGVTLSIKWSDRSIRDRSDIIMANIILAFDDDINLEAMLPQLMPEGTLIVNGDSQSLKKYQALRPDCRIYVIPASFLSSQIYGNSKHTNMIHLGVMMAWKGVDEDRAFSLIQQLGTVTGIGVKEDILNDPLTRKAILVGFYAMKSSLDDPECFSDKVVSEASLAVAKKTKESFLDNILPKSFQKGLLSPSKMWRLKKFYKIKKKLYQWMFQFHPLINRIQELYLHLDKDKPPVSTGDMACGGCGQIQIFRMAFNLLNDLQKDLGKIYISEQDGCGTVFSGMNRTSIWNMPYIRIAFETAHGVAAGLAEATGNKDLVISISGDGGWMQGIRSVEDVLHQQDPILHMVVVNETLGNTGGQAAASTVAGSKTKDGHVSTQQHLNFLKFAEKYKVSGAVASTVHLGDFYRKLEVAHDTVVNKRKPYLLVMHFTCLEQGADLAQSLVIQKMAIESHYINLYSLCYTEKKNSKGVVLYRRKKIVIDWFPWTFSKRKMRANLKKYCKTQKMLHDIEKDPESLDRVFWELYSRWKELKSDMGWQYYPALFKSFFSLTRVTIKRLIHAPPPESKL